MSRRQLILYQRSIEQLFSETSRIDLKWVKWLINGYLVIVITTIILYPLMLNYQEHFSLLYLINVVIATPYIYLIAYKGITQPTIWQVKTTTGKEEIEEQMQRSEEIEKEIHEKQKIQKTGLNDGRINEIVLKITTLMDNERLYQETELTLQDLAKKLDYPSHQVSQAINDGMNKNFYDLVNGYRVEEAKRLLLNPKNRNYTILSVGFEAGFNSKTTFNTVFKKFTGLTPTEFREQQKMKTALA
jgi:AraC-like DNA-binding protein